MLTNILMLILIFGLVAEMVLSVVLYFLNKALMHQETLMNSIILEKWKSLIKRKEEKKL